MVDEPSVADCAASVDLVRAGQASEPRLEVGHCGPERARHAEHSRPGLASPDAVQLDPVHPDRRRVQRLPAGGRRARSGPAGAARALGGGACRRHAGAREAEGTAAQAPVAARPSLPGEPRVGEPAAGWRTHGRRRRRRRRGARGKRFHTQKISSGSSILKIFVCVHKTRFGLPRALAVAAPRGHAGPRVCGGSGRCPVRLTPHAARQGASKPAPRRNSVRRQVPLAGRSAPPAPAVVKPQRSTLTVSVPPHQNAQHARVRRPLVHTQAHPLNRKMLFAVRG